MATWLQERKQQKERDKSKKHKDGPQQIPGEAGMDRDDWDAVGDEEAAEQAGEEAGPSSQAAADADPGPEPTFDIPEHLQVSCLLVIPDDTGGSS